MAQFEEVFEFVDDKTKHLIFGFMREAQSMFRANSTYYEISVDIKCICAVFYSTTAKIARKYHKLSKDWLKEMNYSDYLKFLEKWLIEEETRLIQKEEMKDSDIIDTMNTARYQLLMRGNQNAIGIHKLLKKECGIDAKPDNLSAIYNPTLDIARLYRLYNNIPQGLLRFSNIFKEYIMHLLNIFIDESKMSRDYQHDKLIISLFKVHDRFLRIIEYQFDSKQSFINALNDAFKQVINKEYYVSACLARFSNNLLKKGKEIKEIEMDNTMSSIVTFYNYLFDKDIFERDFCAFFESRLLQDLSKDVKLEQKMIKMLKIESNDEWISKMVNILQDIEESTVLMEYFNSKYETEWDGYYKLRIKVCNFDLWSHAKITPANVPLDLLNMMDRFKELYHNRHPDTQTSNNLSSDEFFKRMNNFVVNGRKLDLTTNDKHKVIDKWTKLYWYNVGANIYNNCNKNVVNSTRRLHFQMNYGSAELSVQFNARCRKILVVSTYQMLILLCFNHKNTWTFEELLEETRIPQNELQRGILSLCHPKVKICRKAPNTKECKMDHKFQINPRYSNPRAKISVPLLNIKIYPPFVPPRPDNYRKRRNQMDAAIVRIMKARQTLPYSDLMSEVARELRQHFTPKASDIKKRIANLCELEYLEQDANDARLYHYRL